MEGSTTEEVRLGATSLLRYLISIHRGFEHCEIKLEDTEEHIFTIITDEIPALCALMTFMPEWQEKSKSSYQNRQIEGRIAVTNADVNNLGRALHKRFMKANAGFFKDQKASDSPQGAANSFMQKGR